MTPTWMVHLYKKAPLRRIRAFEGSGPEYAIRLVCGHASSARLSNVRRVDGHGVPYTVRASAVDPSTLQRQRCRTCCEIMWPELSGDVLLYGDRINRHLDGETIAPMPLPVDVLAALEAHAEHVRQAALI